MEMEYVLINKLELPGSVLTSGSVAKDKILFFDHLNNYTIFNSEKNEIEEITPVAQNKAPLHKYAKNYAISSNNMLAISFKDHHSLMLASFKNGFSELRSCTWHSSDIEVSKFSKDGQYLVTGGTDGKLFVYDVKNLDMVLSLPHNPDYISTISIADDNDLIIYTTFQKKIVFFSFRHNKVLNRIKVSDIVQVSHLFDNNSKVYFALRNGRSIIYDLIKLQTLSDETLFSDWPTSLCYLQDKKYLLVGSKTDLLYIVDMENNTLILKIKMSHSGMSHLNIIGDRLYIGFVEGLVEIVDLNAHAQEFESSLKSKNAHRAKELLDNNSFLYLNSAISIFDDLWPDTLKEASNLLLKEKLEDALHLVEPFLFDKEKSDQFTPLLEQNEKIMKFLNLLQHKKYDDAFIMAEQNSILKKTHLYKKLENLWDKIFNEAKELLSAEPLLNKKKAFTLLEPFMRVEQKAEQTKTLLNNINIFVAADEAVKAKDFRRYFALCEQHHFLKNVSMYTRVCALGDRLYQQMVDLKRENKFEDALEIFKKAKSFANIPAMEFKASLISELEFIKTVEEGKIAEAYAMIDKRVELKMTQTYFKLEKNFENVLNKANKLAREGQIMALIEQLGSYNKIAQTKAKVASILKHAYILEFSKALENKNIKVNWPTTLATYVKMFGRDNEIEKIATDAGVIDILDKLEKSYNSLGYEKVAWTKTLLALE